MNFGEVKGLVIPEGKVARITRKSDGLLLWKGGYTNQVPLSIDTDGSIYNGIGYKNGYRVRSGGAEGAQNGTTCTGFIPVQGGDVVRVSGCLFDDNSTGNAINAADSGFVNLGQLTPSYAAGGYGIFAGTYSAYSWNSVVEESEGVWKWVVPPAASGVAYIRVSGHEGNLYPGANLIVTVNEEIE